VFSATKTKNLEEKDKMDNITDLFQTLSIIILAIAIANHDRKHK